MMTMKIDTKRMFLMFNHKQSIKHFIEETHFYYFLIVLFGNDTIFDKVMYFWVSLCSEFRYRHNYNRVFFNSYRNFTYTF